MNVDLIDILACPLCKSPLRYCENESLLVCRAERLAYPVEDGTPLLLADKAQSLSVDETNRLTR